MVLLLQRKRLQTMFPPYRFCFVSEKKVMVTYLKGQAEVLIKQKDFQWRTLKIPQ